MTLCDRFSLGAICACRGKWSLRSLPEVALHLAVREKNPEPGSWVDTRLESCGLKWLYSYSSLV